MVHHLTKVIGLVQCLWGAKFQLLANVHSRTLINWDFICTLIVKACHLLPYVRFDSWIPAMNYYILEMHVSIPLCRLFLLTIIPLPPSLLLPFTKTYSFFSPQLQKSPPPGGFCLLKASLTTLVHLLLQEILTGCFLYAITVLKL